MNPILMLFAMLFLHIIDDYVLQGVLANLKQQSWWKKNVPDSLYKNDYKIALIEHGYEWSFMIHLPFFILLLSNATNIQVIVYVVLVCAQALLHAWIDNNKANSYKINLIHDQLMHVAQIVVSCILVWLVL